MNTKFLTVVLTTALLTPAMAVAQTVKSTQQVATTAPEYTLIDLPYAPDALAPVISEQTIRLHHGKHLQGYVNNVNRLKRGTAFEQVADLERIVRESKGSLFDNAGQLLNHNLYFTQFAPGGTRPEGVILKLITERWGSMETFQRTFEAEGAKLFGSGWLWLVQTPQGSLDIVREPNGSNPVVNGLTPLLGVDLWEHAYYLDYQNRRADHIAALWQIIDWRVVSSRLR